MATEVKKTESLYSVKMTTGRINFLIDGLTEAELTELGETIKNALEEKDKKEPKRVWNPRSKRHDVIDGE